MLTKDQQRKLSLQYITNEQGEKTAVILPIEEFEELLIDRENLKNIDEQNNEDDLETSAQLYSEIYEEDQDLQELNSSSCIDFQE